MITTSGVPRRLLLRAAGSAAALACVSGTVLAQGSLKQATIMVGSPAGGGIDKIARLYSEGLRNRYAETVLVENRPGAGGSLAYNHVHRSGIKDGSLFFLAPAYPIVFAPHIVRDLPYEPMRDFIPVASGGRSCLVFAVGPAVPASVKTLPNYLDWCKANPKQALYAAQTGTTMHLMGALLGLISGVPLQNVSYKGDAPAVNDLLGGHVPAIILPMPTVLALKDRIRVLAVTRSTRSRFLPEVPSFPELGYQDVVCDDWIGVFVPAGTAPARVRELNQAVFETARSPQGSKALELAGIELDTVTPEAFAEVVKADYKFYADVVRRTNFREIYEKASGR